MEGMSAHCRGIYVSVYVSVYIQKVSWGQVFNWKLLGIVFFGWIGTIVIAGSTSAVIYSVLAYSPCA